MRGGSEHLGLRRPRRQGPSPARWIVDRAKYQAQSWTALPAARSALQARRSLWPRERARGRMLRRQRRRSPRCLTSRLSCSCRQASRLLRPFTRRTSERRACHHAVFRLMRLGAAGRMAPSGATGGDQRVPSTCSGTRHRPFTYGTGLTSTGCAMRNTLASALRGSARSRRVRSRGSAGGPRLARGGGGEAGAPSATPARGGSSRVRLRRGGVF